MALMVSVSACACARPVAPAGKTAGAVCVASPCVKSADCTACYRGEADRNMGRLNDDLPPGGCCPCGPTHHGHTVYTDPCTTCGN
jgi:hypothetical protein